MSIKIHDAIKKVTDKIENLPFTGEPANLYEPLKYMMSIGGKRLRPALTLFSNGIYQNNIDDAIYPAIGLEVFHNFTLIHDDLMDNSFLRRGQATVHSKWNGNIAILSGDAMMIYAYNLMMQTKQDKVYDVLKQFNKTALEICEGQQMDMNFEQQNNVTESEYIRMIELKTSVLIGVALSIGALIGGANAIEQKHWYEVGKNIGIAFQLQDDWLDAFGDTETFGKKIGGDIIANKKTFLSIKAIELANEQDKKTLNTLLNSNQTEPNDKIKQVLALYKKYEIDKYSQQKMNEYNHLAINALEQLPISQTDKNEVLNLIEELNSRKK
jgi:geranylgeranyl diphosphate synthase, type II